MKKSQLLALSATVAGSVAVVTPQIASAEACGSVSGASDVPSCTIPSGSYLQEDLVFKGSKGVSIDYTDDAAYFAACAYHVQGKNSFGMTTNSSLMTVRTSTGATSDSASGCGTV